MPKFGPKKCKFCQHYTVYGPTKSIRCRFFHDFSRKNQCSHAHILSKKRKFSKKHIALMPIFCQKTSILQKTRSSHVIFFIFFLNPMLSCQYLVKNVNSLKSKKYYWHKKSIGCLFFRFFTKKLMLLCPHFVQKRIFSKKICSYAHFL